VVHYFALTVALAVLPRKKIPFKLITFLDFAAERVFLRKVGGGYIFIHRMIMEHFAAMEKE